MMIVSMKGPIIATIPSRTGSSVFAAEWAIAALPSPASLEKAARFIPRIMTPTAPPKIAFLVKAIETISAKVAGIWSYRLTMMKMEART